MWNAQLAEISGALQPGFAGAQRARDGGAWLALLSLLAALGGLCRGSAGGESPTPVDS